MTIDTTSAATYTNVYIRCKTYAGLYVISRYTPYFTVTITACTPVLSNPGTLSLVYSPDSGNPTGTETFVGPSFTNGNQSFICPVNSCRVVSSVSPCDATRAGLAITGLTCTVTGSGTGPWSTSITVSKGYAYNATTEYVQLYDFNGTVEKSHSCSDQIDISYDCSTMVSSLSAAESIGSYLFEVDGAGGTPAGPYTMLPNNAISKFLINTQPAFCPGAC